MYFMKNKFDQIKDLNLLNYSFEVNSYRKIPQL